MQARNENNAKGIDVSHWQGNINWELVKKDGISFAFIKATEKQAYIDKNFLANITSAKKAGILVGAYHFCRAESTNEALKEAEHFIKTIKSSGGFSLFDLPPALDIETKEGVTKGNITAICQAWLNKVKAASNMQPIIYTYLNFAKNYLDKSLGNIPLWFARYDKNQPENVSGWTALGVSPIHRQRICKWDKRKCCLTLSF